MNPAIWIAIYLPLVIIFITKSTNLKRTLQIRILKRKQGVKKMANEMIKSCVGNICTISTGSLGTIYQKVKIIEVIDNWVKIEKKGQTNIINSDYIQSIKVL